MNEKVQLYTFVRTGPSIYLARVERIDVRTGIPGQQNLSLQMRIEQTLWGQSGEPIRRSEFSQPQSEFARLKYPHPIWRHVSMRQDVRVFLVTHELSGVPANPLYVEEVAEPFTRYLHYLIEGPIVSKLFGAEALAKDTDLSDVDREGKIASAMAATFISDLAIYVRLSMGTLMWQRVYSQTNSIGKIAILNATIKGVEDPSEDISRFSIDHLMMAEPAALAQAGVKKSSEAVRLLQQQLGFETSSDVRAHSQKLIDALRSQL